MRARLKHALIAAVILTGCAESFEAPELAGVDVRLAIVHTTDIHSRLLPYHMNVLSGDSNMGLLQENAPFGGISRVAHVVKREREQAPRSIYVDSGDCFQGAPIFNAFVGEVEQRALSLMRPDAVVIGNHEFDEGLGNYVKQLDRWGTYPVVAANYLFEPDEPLDDLSQPIEIINADGLKIGIIGVANFSSLSSVTDVGNSLHIVPLQIHQTVQDWIDVLKPHVDLIIAVSHGGLREDEELIRATEGLDIIMGGHLHIVLNPPKVIKDRTGRDVILAHSGAFAKFVGRLDVVVRDGEVVAHDYEVFPIDATVPEDPTMVDMLEPYRLKLNQVIDLASVYGYSSRKINRFGFDGGDSPLGNLVAESIRQYARSDFAMTNSLGIRTDLNPGAIGLDQLYNVFPFNNYITTMFMSGDDVQAMLDFVTLRSAGRGCATQIQVSGIEFVMDCRDPGPDCTEDCPPRATDIYLTNCGDPSGESSQGCTRIPLDRNAVYEMATNDYVARGGSGFTVLKNNNTQVVTDVALRDAVLEAIMRSPRCVDECATDGETFLEECVGYENCVRDLSEFYRRPCQEASAHIRPTDPQCQRCVSRADCFPCDDGSCTACEQDSACSDGFACVSGFCRPTGIICAGGRCHRDCDRGFCPIADGATAICDATASEACGVQVGESCRRPSDCYEQDGCNAQTCVVCKGHADCDGEQQCLDGYCRSPIFACVDGRCQRQCETNADCPGGDRLSESGQQLCIEGQCLPRGGQPCMDDHGCLDPEAMCPEASSCASCSGDQDCPVGQLCADGKCLQPVASCVQHRCRVDCSDNDDCLPGEGCSPLGYCEPTRCQLSGDPQGDCERLAEWRALERCLEIPCPRAEADGRISRILPENLEDLPEDISPDDIE